VRYEHPPIASLLTGAAQEADLVSPGFEQSRAILNHSTLDYTLHCGERRIVLPGDASWKRLCSSSVPPDDDEMIEKEQWPSNSPNFNLQEISYPGSDAQSAYESIIRSKKIVFIESRTGKDETIFRRSN